MRILEFLFEKGEPTKTDMTFKDIVIWNLISVVLTVVILSCLRANGIIHSDGILGGVIFGVTYTLSYYGIKRIKNMSKS